MTVWKNKKNKQLYLIFESYHPYPGGFTAEPYGWSGKIINQAKLHNFIKVGKR